MFTPEEIAKVELFLENSGGPGFAGSIRRAVQIRMGEGSSLMAVKVSEGTIAFLQERSEALYAMAAAHGAEPAVPSIEELVARLVEAWAASARAK